LGVEVVLVGVVAAAAAAPYFGVDFTTGDLGIAAPTPAEGVEDSPRGLMLVDSEEVDGAAGAGAGDLRPPRAGDLGVDLRPPKEMLGEDVSAAGDFGSTGLAPPVFFSLPS